MRPIVTRPTVMVVEHEVSCGADRFGPWLEEAGVELDVRRPYTGAPLGDLAGVSGLLVLGGDMGAYDDEAAPWLPAVRALLAHAVDHQVPTLGICLGAQLLAVACGGRVEVGAAGTEAGVIDVAWRPEAAGDPLLDGLPAPFPGPSMHDDAIVELPPGAAWLGSTPMYAHQVFRVGTAAWGVQFHPEVAPATISAWADAHPVVARADVEPVFRGRDPEVVAAGRALAHRFAGLVRAGARGAGRASLTA